MSTVKAKRCCGKQPVTVKTTCMMPTADRLVSQQRLRSLQRQLHVQTAGEWPKLVVRSICARNAVSNACNKQKMLNDVLYINLAPKKSGRTQGTCRVGLDQFLFVLQLNKDRKSTRLNSSH